MTVASVTALGAVQKTLLLPLWGRALETNKPRPLLLDPTAARIIASIDYDFSTIAGHISYVSQLAWIARSLHIDRTIRLFLKQYPAATIVNLGCGLDTTFERVDNGTLRWFDLDLPDVIALRGQYIQQTPRRCFLACSILDYSWTRSIAPADGLLLIAAGVLYYFNENEVKALFRHIASHFPGCEFIFDVCSPRGARIANQRVIRDGGMDTNAQLKWGLNSAAELHAWDQRITVLAAFPIFHGLKRKFPAKQKIGTFLSDALRIMSMVHVAIAADGGN
jgi:O-methyltransferase involved in polyketide biosynthesis